MEKDISAKEKEYENQNNLKLPTSPAPVIEVPTVNKKTKPLKEDN